MKELIVSATCWKLSFCVSAVDHVFSVTHPVEVFLLSFSFCVCLSSLSPHKRCVCVCYRQHGDVLISTSDSRRRFIFAILKQTSVPNVHPRCRPIRMSGAEGLMRRLCWPVTLVYVCTCEGLLKECGQQTCLCGHIRKSDL